MTTTAMLDKTADHPEIWLQPRADAFNPEGRMWRQDNQWGDEGVRYVRADLSHAAGDVAGLVAELRTDSYALSDVHVVTAPLRDLRHKAATTLLALSARAEAAEARVKEMTAAGASLANIAFNLSQLSGLSERDKTILDEARKAWDAARSLSPIKGAGRG